MGKIKYNQQGHVHLLLVVVVLLAVAAIGGFVYYKNYGPSKVDDPTVKAQLKQASSDLKAVNLAQIKSSVDSVSSSKNAYKNQ